MSAASGIVKEYASMWPREVFDVGTSRGRIRMLRKLTDAKWLEKKGVYILYRDDHPYYIGRAENSLYKRLHDHANKATGGYFNFWSYFSAFVVHKGRIRDVEAILIAAMPTAVNSATPKVGKRKTVPKDIREKMRKARQSRYDFSDEES
jgi:hypothetical protein